MGIELRRGKPYYYRKVRRGAQVVSRYGGSGEFGQILWMIDEAERIEREGEAEQRRAEWKRLEDEDRAFAGYFDRVEVQARAILTAAGYHQHKGQWRKRRGQAEDTVPQE